MGLDPHAPRLEHISLAIRLLFKGKKKNRKKKGLEKNVVVAFFFVAGHKARLACQMYTRHTHTKLPSLFLRFWIAIP